MKSLKKYFFVLFLFIIYFLFSIFSYSNAVSTNISDNVFRLHVIANSNSDSDQKLKYAVRDAIIEYMNSFSENINTKEEAINLAYNNIDTLKQISQNIITQSGYNYKVNIEIGNFDFPTKTYGDISFPSGFYDAIKIEIGDAQGQNWWCVMFPSLCFIDVSNGIVPDDSKDTLKENLDEESYNLVSFDNSNYEFKFKLVEWFENAKIFVAKK